jgi:hypothetical protein
MLMIHVEAFAARAAWWRPTQREVNRPNSLLEGGVTSVLVIDALEMFMGPVPPPASLGEPRAAKRCGARRRVSRTDRCRSGRHPAIARPPRIPRLHEVKPASWLTEG